MKDIAIYKTIHIDESAGVHPQQYVLCGQPSELYKLDLINFEVLEFSKYIDGDQLTLQLSPDFLDGLCDAWTAHRNTAEPRR